MYGGIPVLSVYRGVLIHVEGGGAGVHVYVCGYEGDSECGGTE